jgi:TP901 family phage tail tape measure protein
MADLTKTIEVIFKGVDDTSDAISKIGSSISSFSSSVGSVTGPISNFTTSLLKVEAGIVAVGAAALAYSVNESVKFESAFLDFKKVANDISEKDMPALITRVEELGVKYGTSATDVLSAATNFVQAGFDTADSFRLVEVAATAAVVSELSAAEASDVLVRSLVGFGAGAGEAGRLLDIFNKVSDSTAASFPELANGFADLAPIASTLGLTFEETAAFLVPIIERFGSGSEAANALKTAFSRLIDPTKETREALDEVGISQRATNGEFLTGRPLLEAVQRQFSTLTDENKLFVAAQLVGINQAARFVPILSDQEGYMKALAAATNSSGSALAEFNNRINSTEIQFQRLGVAFDITAKKVGDEFRPIVGQGADSLRGLIDVIGKLVSEGKLDTFFAALTPIFEDFNRTIDSIARNLPAAINGVDFTPIKRALDDLRGAFGGVFEGIDLSTPEGLARALQQIVNIGASLIDFTRGVVEGFTPFIQKMGEAANEASGMGRELIAGFGQLAGAATAINALLPFVTTLGAAITALGTAFGTLSALKSLGVAVELSKIGDAASGLAVSLGRAGLAGTVGAATFGLTSLAVETEAGQSAMTSFLDLIGDITGQTDDMATALGPLVYELESTGTAASSAGKSIGDVATAQVSAKSATERWADEVAAMTKLFLDAGFVYDSTTGKIQKQSDALDEAAQAAQFAEDQNRGFIKSVVDGTTSYEQFGTKFASSIGKVETEADKATKAADKIKEKMLELASDERIKAIEFSVKLQTAQIEADTERVKAAFDSVNSSIQNTGDVISSALGALGDVGGFYGLEQLELIEKQLEKENKYRQDALDLQKDLVEAQINEIDARAEQISKGNAVIQIDGKGLEPELEAFMFKILKKIQTRANAEAASFLLGI